MAIMAGNGALAGTLSPFAPTGIVAQRRDGSASASAASSGRRSPTTRSRTRSSAFGGFFLLGGWRLFTRRDRARRCRPRSRRPSRWTTRHWLTAAGIAALIVGVAGFGMNVGMVALIIATALILLRTVDEQKAIQRMPWGVILMVTGVTVLVAMLREDRRASTLFTTGIAQLSTPATIAPIVAFGTGVVSVYSSTSGVVLPAFLPMVPDLAQRLGGIEPLPIAWSMNVGASLVDLSSLSTVGALFIAGAAPAHRHARAVQRAARLGAVDGGRRRRALLGAVRLGAVRLRRSLAAVRLTPASGWAASVLRSCSSSQRLRGKPPA